MDAWPAKRFINLWLHTLAQIYNKNQCKLSLNTLFCLTFALLEQVVKITVGVYAVLV